MPATVPEELLPAVVQVHVQLQVGLDVEVPPTGLLFWQQGLQQRCATKSGNVSAPCTLPLQAHIYITSIEKSGSSAPGSFYAGTGSRVSGFVGFRLYLRHGRVADFLRLCLRCLLLFHTLTLQ